MPLPAAVTRLANFTQRQLDRLVPPESRQEAYTKARAFANQRPLLFSFIAVQALFAAMPILAFLNFLFFLVFWAATAALLFSMFWTLVATFILVPVLGIAFTAGLFFWTVGFVAFITGRTGFNGLRGIAATLDTQTDGTRPGEDNKEPRRAESAESSLSGLATSWANLDTQDIKQEDGPGSSSQTMPAHPDPGSDLDALEP